MITSKKLFVVATLVAASIAFASPDGITLRKVLKSGTESYHMVSSAKQTISLPGGSGDQELSTKSTTSYTFKIGTVDGQGQSAPLEMISKMEKFDVDGPMAEMVNGNKDKFLKAVTTTGTLDSRNRFVTDTKTKVDPMAVMNGATNSTLAGIFIEFPDKPVNVGDTWDVTVKKGPLTGKEDQKLTAKLTGEKVVDGKPVYVIALTGTLKTDINLGELMKNSGSDDAGPLSQMDIQIKGTIEFNGEASVDKANGQTVLMTLKLTTKQDMDVAGQSIPSTGTSEATLTLDK